MVPFQFCCINRTRYILHRYTYRLAAPAYLYSYTAEQRYTHTIKHYTASIYSYTPLSPLYTIQPMQHPLLSLVKTRRIDLHVPRNGSVRGAGTGLEPSLGYDCSRCRGSLPATMNEWLPARVMCVSSPRYHGIPCGAPRCPNSCYIYGRPERDADYLPTV